jgi:hypothetical protein
MDLILQLEHIHFLGEDLVQRLQSSARVG